MSDKFYSQARKIVNNEIEWCQQWLEQSEYAATRLASAFLNNDPLQIKIIVYDRDETIAEYIIVATSLESVWRFVLSQHKITLEPDNVDIIFIIGDREYMFSYGDIQTAWENVRYESKKQRAKKMEGEQWRLS